jgi:hypothetical protein
MNKHQAWKAATDALQSAGFEYVMGYSVPDTLRLIHPESGLVIDLVDTRIDPTQDLAGTCKTFARV